MGVGTIRVGREGAVRARWLEDSCYNFSCHVTVGPTSDHVRWPAQLLESRLAYFVLGVTLTADSGPGFTHMRPRLL
jgi:hypothetical protein